MIEWGLTPEEFANVDIEIIKKILEYREAQNKGISARARRQKL